MKHRMLRVVQRLFQYQVLLTGEPLEFGGAEVECPVNKTFMQLSRCRNDGTAPDPQGHTESRALPPLAPSYPQTQKPGGTLTVRLSCLPRPRHGENSGHFPLRARCHSVALLCAPS